MKLCVFVADFAGDGLDRLVTGFQHLLGFLYPLFDLLFGTFKNPKDFAAEQGFYDGASARVVDMLRGHDVANARLGRTQPLSHAA